MSDNLTIGWREWVQLPGLNIPWVKAKIDTGARTSAIHAFYTERFTREGAAWVRFGVHPIQGDSATVIDCEAPLIDERSVTDSGGHREQRPVILTPLTLGGVTRDVEMTLTDRDSMLFRMLVGRTAMNRGIVVSPGCSFLTGGDKLSPPETS
ncbi:MAG: ATP-dependent zinc protease [Halieaceae bacterium]|jgi:hypothetical protein|nr:ATP-dependent zinc protease [Halieaceae bacterium]